MKRVLQRIWFWIPYGLTCCATVGLVAFGGGEVMQASKLEKRLDALDSRLATNGLVMAEDELMLTNWASTNLLNYYGKFVTNLSVYQIYPSNYTTIEWVGKIVTADTSDLYRSPLSFLKDCELGLRSDGVVVWREKK